MELSLSINVEDDDDEYLQEFWGNDDGVEDSETAGEDGVDMHDYFDVKVIMDSGTYGEIKLEFPRCYYTSVPTAITGAEPRRPDLAIACEADTVELDDGTTEVHTPLYVRIENALGDLSDKPSS